MLPPPTIRDWASKLIASEVDADSASAPTEPATLRVYEKLRRQFCAPVGVDAFQALTSRALSLTKSQFPGLSIENITANGSLRGYEVETLLGCLEDDEVGVILIAQILRLFMTLLGEAATLRLIEEATLQLETKVTLDTTSASIDTPDTSHLGPFKDISSEADQLRHVSERLEAVASTHTGVDELMSVAGSIRNIATVLDVFTVIRSKAGGSEDSVLTPPANGYLN